MCRLREKKPFNQRSVPSEEIEPIRKFYFAFEGNNTEPEYFNGINDNRRELNISALIGLVLLERDDDDTKSHPKHVLDGMVEALNSSENTFDEECDEAWLVIDRDKGNFSKKQLDDLRNSCAQNQKNIQIALSNPAFEFWLLCHFSKIMTLDKDKLLKNEKTSIKHSFISNELTELLPNGFSKKKDKLIFSDFINKIDLAIQQSKLFETDIKKLDDKLGTNLGLLLEKLKSSN